MNQSMAIFKLIGVALSILAAVLVSLVILDQLEWDELKHDGGKILLIALVVAVMTLVINMISGSGKTAGKK